MNAIHFTALAVLTSGFWIVGCDGVSRYTGDGMLVDQGLFAAKDRYILELDTINLDRSNIYRYRMSGLPTENFAVGFEVAIQMVPEATANREGKYPTLGVTLTNSSGAVIFTHQAPMDTWTWATPREGANAFVYERDLTPTYFDATPDEDYVLIVEVHSEHATGIHARLLVKSGGWK